jgi:hypothetical protein
MDRYDPLTAPNPEGWLALDEGERTLLIEDYHRRARVRLPNASVHAAVHTVIENQAALGDETPVRRTLDRLMSEGLDRHDAIHAIGLVLTELFYDTMTGAMRENTSDASREYFAAVERTTAAAWLASAEEAAEGDMDVAEMLDTFADHDGVPVEAIRAARAQREVAVPAFLDVIERYLDDDTMPHERDALFLIFHLLGEWREQKAYRPLARLLRGPPDELSELLGDAITETSHRVMAAVFDGDPQPLYDIVTDPRADEFVRARMCEALAILVLRDQLPRAELVRFLERCYSGLSPQKDCHVWVGWAGAISMLGLVELDPLVVQAFKRGSIAAYEMDFEDFAQDLKYGIEHPGAPPRYAADKEFTLFGDTIEELSTWAAFNPQTRRDEEDEVDFSDGSQNKLSQWSPWVPASNPFKGIGRNDPCPCGSGKKFKKCCLGQAAA